MNKVKLPHHFAASETTSPEAATTSSQGTTRWMRLLISMALGAGLALCPPSSPHAQRVREPGVKVTRIASSSKGREGVVSISADGNLNRAQTFQENGRFHIVLPYAKTDLAGGTPRGVKTQRVGDSLEIIVPVKPGSSVTVQPRFNRLDLVVDGGLSSGAEENNARSNRSVRESSASSAQKARSEAPQRERREPNRERSVEPAQPSPRRETASAYVVPAGRQSAPVHSAPSFAAPSFASSPAAPAFNSEVLNTVPGIPASTVPGVPTESVPGTYTARPEVASNASADAQNPGLIYGTKVEEGESAKDSTFFSASGLLIMFGILMLIVAAYVLRRNAVSGEESVAAEKKKEAQKTASAVAELDEGADHQPFEQHKGDRRRSSVSVAQERRRSAELVTHQLHPSGALVPEQGGERGERKGEPRVLHAPAPSVLFGAYRIDQEVAKLAQGDAHSIDVLASRAPDDRRAIETSLIKILQSPIEDEGAKRRARGALEEYGFVARQSAALLLANDAYDRVSAARVLGQVKSASTLPFLLEALYDGEQVVRTEVVASLGALALPKAIGALLDMARRYPEIPAALIGNALTACSVESLELSWRDGADSRTFSLTGSREEFTGEIIGLEPTEDVEQLPEWLEDETLADALERLESVDVEARITAAQSLAMFQVRRSVEALSAMAQHDASPAVRGAAVTSLGQIDHESVFAPVLVAMADEAREVRAAAARALSGLSFERADAYVRVIETADAETLTRVAHACLKAGLMTQAVNRLASQDRRQAYEAFSMLSLAARAGEVQLILEAIEKHTDMNVRVAAVRLLGQISEPEVLEHLREIASHGGVPEELRVAILEVAQRGEPLQAETV